MLHDASFSKVVFESKNCRRFEGYADNQFRIRLRDEMMRELLLKKLPFTPCFVVFSSLVFGDIFKDFILL